MPYGHTVDDFVHDLKILLRAVSQERGRGSRWLPLLVAALRGAADGRASRRSERASRDELFEIPKGTYARRMAGDKVEILPVEDSPDARPQRRAAAAQSRRRAAGVRADDHDAGPEFPAAVREGARATSSRARRTRADR